MIDLQPIVRTYCEFVYWSHPDQPFNVYSTIVYPIVALLMLMRRKDFSEIIAPLLALLLVLAGAASALWHATMAPEAQMADWAATVLLSATLAFLVLRYVFYMPLKFCIPLVPLLLEAGFIFRLPESKWIAADSVALLPFVAMLAAAGAWSTARHSNAGLYLLMASFWLAGGFLVLSSDQSACAIFPTGTHFLWHILAPVAVLCISRAVAAADIELIDQNAGQPANIAMETPDLDENVEKITDL